MKYSKLSNNELLERAEVLTSKKAIMAMAKDLEFFIGGNASAITAKVKLLEHIKSLATPEGQLSVESVDPEEEVTEEEEEVVPDMAPVVAKDTFQEDLEAEEAAFLKDLQVTKTKPKTKTENLLKLDPTKEEDPIKRRAIIRAQALRLVRVRIVNMDPTDSDLPGGIITVRTKYTGKVSKLIPYGDESENGYHIPQILLDDLKQRRFCLHKEVKTSRFGVKTYKTSLVPKFNITVLPPLTDNDRKAMANRQAAAQTV